MFEASRRSAHGLRGHWRVPSQSALVHGLRGWAVMGSSERGLVPRCWRVSAERPLRQ